MIQLSTEYSIAWTILCGIVSFLFAYWLYRKSPFSKKWSAILALLRFFTIFLLSFFLLNPFLNFEIVEKEKPIVVFAIDNSASMVRSGDSLFLKKELSKQIDAFTKENIDDFKIDTYTFGESTKLNGQSDFSDKKTDISQLISDLNANYSNRNICALTIVSDGLYNYGKNPNYQSFDFDAPIYSLAVGDTSVYKDVKG